MGNWLESIFLQILNMSVTAGYCIAAVLLLRVLFRKAPRKYLYALWLVVAFRLICPVSLGSALSFFQGDLFSVSTPTEAVGSMEYLTKAGLHTGNLTLNTFVNEQVPHAVYTVSGYSVKTLWQTFLPVLAYVWVAGIAVFAVYYAMSAARLKKITRWAVRVSGLPAPEVYECDELSSPFAMGVFRPRIYLPCHLEGEERQMILLHEQYHIRRKDHVVKLLAYGVLSVYWFHPLVWAAWFCMCKDMEMSCDEHVLELLGEGNGKAYSKTLLAFAAEQPPGSRMPLGFGEHDVKSRIQHVLAFQKPTVWVSMLAMAAIAAVLLVFGTNGRGEETTIEVPSSFQKEAQLLYESRNPYVGDISADGKVIRAIREVFPGFAEITSYKTELQTSEEPYEFHFILETADAESPKLTRTQEAELSVRMVPAATLMLTLIDNLGEVKWSWQVTEGNEEYPVFVQWDVKQAESWYGIENLKAYADSSEQVEALLDRMSEVQGPTNEDLLGELYTAQDKDLKDFEKWYASLPYELYEHAMPHGSEYWSYQKADTVMTILAQTSDKVVTVYGCTSEEYGNRGITIDYRITSDGDSNHTYLDFGWNETRPGILLENRQTPLLARDGIPQTEEWKIGLDVEYHFFGRGRLFYSG